MTLMTVNQQLVCFSSVIFFSPAFHLLNMFFKLQRKPFETDTIICLVFVKFIVLKATMSYFLENTKTKQ